jgi:signal transduction histidine kinase
MPDHIELVHHCEAVTQQIRAILKANHVFIQRYLAATGTWQSLSPLTSQQEYDAAVAPPVSEPEVSGELTLFVGQQLRNLEAVNFKIVTKIGRVSVRGNCLLLPIASNFHKKELWGRICIIGNERTYQSRDLEWLKTIATMLGQSIAFQKQNSLSLGIAHIQPLAAPVLLLNDRESIEHLHRQIAELATRDQAKDEFIGKISHDLRAPLMNMRMALKMLQINVSQNPAAAVVFSGERIASYFSILNSECEREIGLIDNVLDLQKLETGNINLQIASIDLADWLPQIVGIFQSRVQSQQQQLDLRLPESPALLNTDENYLNRILTELFHNACKYTARGGQIICEVEYPPVSLDSIQIQSGSGRATHPRQPLYVTVSNQAEISAIDLPHLFDRFYRVPAADHHKQGGTGLGLFLVRNLVEQLQGQITVQSSNGWTTFTVALPIVLSTLLDTLVEAELDESASGNAQLVAEL